MWDALGIPILPSSTHLPPVPQAYCSLVLVFQEYYGDRPTFDIVPTAFIVGPVVT
jgi:hypothetical protein